MDFNRRVRRRFSCACSRREFLGTCAALGVGAFGLEASAKAPEGAPKAKVRLVFTHIPPDQATWPNIGYDYEGRKKELRDALVKACPEIEFLPATALNAGEAKKILEADAEVDGYLVYTVGIWTGAPQAIAASGKPTLIVDDLYGGSGEFLIAYAACRRAGHKVAGVSSSRFQDVVDAARSFASLKRGATADEFVAACVEKRKKSTPAPSGVPCKPDKVQSIGVAECLERLRGKKLLVVGGGWGMPASGKAVEEVLGIQVVPIEFPELHSAWERADRGEAEKWAERWRKGAERVLEPTQEDLVASGAMHVAMLELLGKHKAQGITINCLGGFYGGHLKAYPCLGFTELNDAGLVGGCEGDINSAITMLAVSTLVGRPGYISDPVIDTSKRQIIYAHCVAPTKVFGPSGPACPYHIRSHSEDRKGAVVRSILPLGYQTTTLEIDCSRRRILMHQGRAVDNIDEDKACRNKLAVEVAGDTEKLLEYWDQWGWHRVTFYGDLKEEISELAKKLKMEIVEEA